MWGSGHLFVPGPATPPSSIRCNHSSIIPLRMPGHSSRGRPVTSMMPSPPAAMAVGFGGARERGTEGKVAPRAICPRRILFRAWETRSGFKSRATPSDL